LARPAMTPESGLSAGEAHARLLRDGPNRLPAPAPATLASALRSVAGQPMGSSSPARCCTPSSAARSMRSFSPSRSSASPRYRSTRSCARGASWRARDLASPRSTVVREGGLSALEPGSGRGRPPHRPGRRSPGLRRGPDRSAVVERRRIAADRRIGSGRKGCARRR
jgi:hypothetical protein